MEALQQMAFLDKEVQIAIISMMGGVLIAYITNVVAKQRKASPPKDRMETIFDGYESLIKQQQQDITRKEQQLKQTQNIIDRLQKELDDTREIVRTQQRELLESKSVNQDLKAQLEAMKRRYKQEIIEDAKATDGNV